MKIDFQFLTDLCRRIRLVMPNAIIGGGAILKQGNSVQGMHPGVETRFQLCRSMPPLMFRLRVN